MFAFIRGSFSAGNQTYSRATVARHAVGVALALAVWGQLNVPAALAEDELDYGLEERKVDAVRFTGNRAFSKDELVEMLGLRKPSWISLTGKSRYRSDELAVGLRAIEDNYRRGGYHSVQVKLDKIEEDEARGDVIYVVINEGRYVEVASVEFSGSAPIKEADLRKVLVHPPNGPAPYRDTDLGRDVYVLRDRYLSMGYLGTQIKPTVVRTDSLVYVRYDIKPGPQYRVGNVEVVGNTKTREDHVRREFRFRKGDRIDLDRIALTEGDLLDTGWFRDVSFSPTRLDSAAATADLVLLLIERPTGFWEFGVGTGDEDRFRLSAAWGQKNFLGSGRGVTVRGRLLWGLERRFDEIDADEFALDHEEEVLYRHPRLVGSRFDVGLSAFFRKETRGESGVVLETSGLLANTSLFTGRHTTTELEASVQRVLKLPFGPDDDFLQTSRGQTRSLSLVIARDSRDSYFNPRRGSLRQVLAQGAGGPWVGGDNTFNKVLASFVRFRRIPGNSVLALRAQAGWAEAWWRSDDDGVPLEDRFFAGGSNSVRGYRDNSLGPRVTAQDSLQVSDARFLANRPASGGTALVLANAEIRFPIPLLSRLGFTGAVFADGGNVWEDWSRVSLSQFRLSSSSRNDDPTTILDFRTSVGWSLHYNTPVGPFRIDYGLPLKRARLVSEDDEEVDPHHIWHFSLGHAF